MLVTFDALLLCDIEHRLDAFDEDEKHGDARARIVSDRLAAQVRLSLFVVGVGDDVEYLINKLNIFQLMFGVAFGFRI